MQGNIDRSCGYRANGVSIMENFGLSINMGYKTSEIVMISNVVLIPGKPTPKSNFRDGT